MRQLTQSFWKKKTKHQNLIRRGSCLFVSFIKITSRRIRGWSFRHWREMVPLPGWELSRGQWLPITVKSAPCYTGDALWGGRLLRPGRPAPPATPCSLLWRPWSCLYAPGSELPAERGYLSSHLYALLWLPPWLPSSHENLPPNSHPLPHRPALFSP